MRVPKVHKLIKELVTNDKVVSDAFLLDLLEIFPHYLTNSVHETEQHGHVRVSSHGGDHVDIALLDVGEGALICFNQRTGIILLLPV